MIYDKKFVIPVHIFADFIINVLVRQYQGNYYLFLAVFL